MKLKIVDFNQPHALVEYATDDDSEVATLNVRIDKNPDGSIPSGQDLIDYLMSFAPPLGQPDPYAGVDWSGVIAAVEPKTQERIAQELEWAVQNHLDATVRIRGYDSVVSACSYAASVNPFQAEGIACLNWRASVWSACYQILSDVNAGLRSTPTVGELIAELPVMVWPE